MVIGKFVDTVDKFKNICLYKDDKKDIFWAVNLNGGFHCYTQPFKSEEDMMNHLRWREIEWMSLSRHCILEEKMTKA